MIFNVDKLFFISLKIPLSSVYKKISDLEHLTLLKVEKTILSEKGRHVAYLFV